MNEWTTKYGYKIIRVLSGRSNAYLVLNKNITILVDTGKKTAFRKLTEKLDTLNVSIESLSYLILTHTHFDHCQSAKRIAEKSGCRIIVSGNAADSIKNGYTKLPDGTFLPTKLISKLGQLIGKSRFGYEPFQPDILVNGDTDLEVSKSSIKIIETAGHSVDSISILVDNEIAIVGDAMFGIFKKSIFPPYADDTAKMIESWGKLLHTDCQIFLPGHGRAVKRSLLQKEYDKYARKHNN
jgi:glyoxylase-like metal-dependent hydrolase (beta-lactamase superfamily II)